MLASFTCRNEPVTEGSTNKTHAWWNISGINTHRFKLVDPLCAALLAFGSGSHFFGVLRIDQLRLAIERIDENLLRLRVVYHHRRIEPAWYRSTIDHKRRLILHLAGLKRRTIGREWKCG